LDIEYYKHSNHSLQFSQLLTKPFKQAELNADDCLIILQR